MLQFALFITFVVIHCVAILSGNCILCFFCFRSWGISGHPLNWAGGITPIKPTWVLEGRSSRWEGGREQRKGPLLLLSSKGIGGIIAEPSYLTSRMGGTRHRVGTIFLPSWKRFISWLTLVTRDDLNRVET